MKRNYGIDLLRLVLMFMVVVLHVLGHGGVLSAAQPMSGQYITAWLMESLAIGAVNSYAIITGGILVIAGCIYGFRRRLIIQPLTRFLANLLLNDQ